jgi:hypothetical protein
MLGSDDLDHRDEVGRDLVAFAIHRSAAAQRQQARLLDLAARLRDVLPDAACS